MVVSNEVKCLPFILQFDRRFHHSEIVPQVQRPGRLYARQNSHLRKLEANLNPGKSRAGGCRQKDGGRKMSWEGSRQGVSLRQPGANAINFWSMFHSSRSTAARPCPVHVAN